MRTSQYKPFTLTTKTKLISLATTIALLPLVAFLTLILTPSLAPDSASATSQTSEMAVGIPEVLSLRIVKYNEETHEWDIDTDTVHAEAPHGTFGTASVKVIASTNGPGGYTLSLNDIDNNNDLTSPRILDTIPSLSEAKTLDDITDTTEKFPEERWGYSWAKNSDTPSLTFDPVPLSNASASAKQKDSTDALGYNSYLFTLGVRAAEDTPAETYEDQVMFTLVGNPSPTAPLFFRTEYMQDFTTQICNTVKTPLASTTDITQDSGNDYMYSGGYATKVPSTKIKDKRDNQEYTIRKLADGNCWMTENLRLGKEGAVTLDSTNSNLASGRTFTLPAAKTTTGTSWGNQEKFKFVFYRDSNPAAINPTVKPEGVTPDSPSALYNWYTATAGARPASDPSTSDPYAGDCNDDPDSATNCGSLMTAASGEASDSVCPKNWQLPVNGSGYGTSRSYMNLINIYTNATGNSWADINGSPGQAAINEANIKKLLDKPTSFVYSDDYSREGALYSRPVSHYWSSSVYSVTDSYFLYLGTNDTGRNLVPRVEGGKGSAFAVRCVVAP